MRILVTGSNGFVGRNLVRLLKENQIDVIGLDRSPSNKDFIDTLYYTLGSNREDISVHLRGVDCIVHLASTSKGDIVQSNTSGICELLEAAKKLKVKQIVVLSTAEVSMSDEDFLTEKYGKYSCGSLYSASKACEEVIARSYTNHSDLPIVLVRSVNIFGEEQRKGLIPYFAEMALKNKPIEVFAREALQWVYVDHVCEILNEVAISTMVPPGTVLHISGTKEIYSSALACSVIGISGSRSELKLLEGKPSRFSLKRTEETDRFLLDNRYDEGHFISQLKNTVLSYIKKEEASK